MFRRKQVAYELVVKDYADALSNAVTNLLERGFELYGQPFQSNGNRFCQPMVKYDDEIEND